MHATSTRLWIGLLFVLALVFWAPVALAQTVLPSFTDLPIPGSPYINPALGGASTTTGITGITASCPNGLVNLNLDGIIVQKIQVANPITNLHLSRVQIWNLGSAPFAESGL